MKKKELLEKLDKFNSKEATITNLCSSSLSGNIFAIADILNTIKVEKLYKAIKKDHKSVYSSFKSYMDHFKWSPSVLKMLKKVNEVREVIAKNNLWAKSTFVDDSIDFWTEFKKIAKCYWVDAINEMYNESTTDCIDLNSVKAFLKAHPECKIGSTKSKILPSFTQLAITNAIKADYNENANLPDSLLEQDNKQEREAAVDALTHIARRIASVDDEYHITRVDKPVVNKIAAYKFISTAWGLVGTRYDDVYVYEHNQMMKIALSALGIGIFLGTVMAGLLFKFM